LVALLVRLTEPLLRPARRLIPPIGGLDLSPIAVLIGLQLALILLVQPLFGLARAWF
jgi:YggT family protein